MSSPTDESLGKGFKKGKEISRFIRNRFSVQGAIKELAGRKVTDINSYLFDMLVQTGGRLAIDHIDKDTLYVVHHENLEPEGFLCFLGVELLDPEVRVSALHHKERHWLLTHGTDVEKVLARTKESWRLHQVEMALAQIQTFAFIASLEVRAWWQVYKAEGEPLRRRLLVHHLELLEKLESDKEKLKKYKGPEFMIADCEESIVRIKRIMGKLNGETSPPKKAQA